MGSGTHKVVKRDIDAGRKLTLTRERAGYPGRLTIELKIIDSDGSVRFAEWFDPDHVHSIAKQFGKASALLRRGGI